MNAQHDASNQPTDIAGRVCPEVGEKWDVAVSGNPTNAAGFVALPVYPAVSRDLALIVKADIAAESVRRLLVDRGARHGLESVAIIDEYRGKELAAGTRSITVRLVFRSSERTLTDTEVEQATTRLRTSLERELDVTIRST